jgi:integrase/recombinase XerD
MAPPPKSPLPPELAEALHDFLESLRAEAGASRHTLAAYRGDLRLFFGWCREQGLESLAAIEPDHVHGFLAWLRTEGVAEATVARRLTAVRMLLAHGVAVGSLARDPASRVRAPRLRRSLPPTLSIEDVESLLAAPTHDPGLAPWRAQRDRALLEVLYACGARVSEAVGLRTDGLEPTLRVLRLTGKGNRTRLVPCGERAREALETWLAGGRTELPDARKRNEVFLTRSGAPLDRTNAWRAVQRAARVAGLRGKLSPHTLRHAFATHLIEGGADLRSVQELLGHASIGTTEIYAHLDAEKLLSLHRLFHPRG